MIGSLQSYYARLYREVFSLELRKIFSYRVDFWFRFLGTLVANLVVAYYLWGAIFADMGVAEIQGFSFGTMMLYYALVPLVENITRGQETGLISAEIYSGGLTRYLVYPVNFFPFKFVGVLAHGAVATLQLALILGGYALTFGFPDGVTITFGSMVSGIVAAFIGSAVNFLLVAAVEMVAFWVDSVWSLNVMLMFLVRLLGGAMLPLALFPSWSHAVLAWTPFPYLMSFPLLTMMGQVSASDWGFGLLIMGLWIVILAGINAAIWRRGNLHYTGVGQ